MTLFKKNYDFLAELYNQRKYQCDIKDCSKRFREQLFLDRHKLTHTGEQRKYLPFIIIKWNFHRQHPDNIVCSCFFSFAAHQCESCNARYSDISSLKKHLKNCAPHLIKGKPQGPLKCPHCSRGLFTVRGWLTHKSSHTDLIHDCEYENCTESFRSTAEIMNHVKTVHAHELKSFQCDYEIKCSCSYPLKYLLDGHIDRHKRQSEHLCTECGRVFSTAGGLSTHMKRAHRYLWQFTLWFIIRNLNLFFPIYFLYFILKRWKADRLWSMSTAIQRYLSAEETYDNSFGNQKI